MIGRARIVVLAATFALLAAACGPADNNAASIDDLPPAPPVRELRSTEPVVPDDGLHHIVVTIPRTTRPDGSSTQSSGGTAPGHNFALTVEMLAALPDGVTLVAENGSLGYRNDDGELVVLGPVETGSIGDESSPATDDGGTGSEVIPSAVAERLASLPGVQSVAPITDTSYAVTADSVDVFDRLGVTVARDGFLALTGDPYEPYQWPLDNRGDNLDQLPLASVPVQSIGADVDGLEARPGATGAGIVVAVVDSGVDFAHPDLTGTAWVNPGEDCDGGAGNGIDDDGNGFVDDCTGWDFGNDDPVVYDGSNDAHGTHVAGVIAATVDNDIGIAGLAPDAAIMDLRVDSSDGVIRASAIARAIRYAADSGADIVNLSLASQPGASPETMAEIAEAVDHAADKGVLLVVAAGNNGASLDDSPVFPASLDAANMIVVAASTPDDRPAEFSNTGSPVDVFAPGQLVLSTVPGDGLAFHSGTSQAAPLVAAAAALVREHQPDLAPADVIRRLTSTADGNENLSPAGAGAGRVNAAAAIGIEMVDDLATGLVTINGLADDDDGLVTATIELNVDGGQFNQPFHWEASLVTIIGADPFAVVDHPVTTGRGEPGSEASGAGETATDERGAVYLADQDSSSASWSTTLPVGLYALVIEAVPRTDSTVRLGDAFVATFKVGDGSGGDESGDGEAGDGSGDLPENRPGDPGDDLLADGPEDGTNNGEGESAVGGEDSDDDGLEPDTGSTTGDGGADGDNLAGDESRDEDPDAELPAETEPGPESDDEGVDQSGRSGAATDEESDDSPNGRGNDNDRPDGDGASEADTFPDTGGDSDDEEIELGPDRARNGEWNVTDIEPRTGWIDTENLVQITGTFPRSVEVWFDDNPAYVQLQSAELLLVRTGRHETAGPVDVTLVSGIGETTMTLPDAYAFLDPDDDTTVTIDVGGGDGGSSPPGNGSETSTGDSDAGEQPVFDLDPGDGIPVSEPPTVSDGSGMDGDASDPGGRDDSRSRNRQARAELIGKPKVLDNGLTVIPLDGLSTIGAVPACNEDPCRTRRI